MIPVAIVLSSLEKYCFYLTANMTQFVANSAVHTAHIWDISIFMQMTEQEVENVGNEIQR